jgi:hypothetical protein
MAKNEPQFRLPTSSQRIAIVGRTGSGKTIAGLWHLSNANFDVMPWVIIDYKTDDHIALIDRAQYIDLDFTPKNPGIYIVQPEPDDPRMFDFLTRIWQRTHIGVYLDEGYMIAENKNAEKRFKTLLTQGRSKHIPMIVLSQRPVWISRFVWSESDFYQVFDIAMEDDVDTIERMLPKGAFVRMPDFHSIYYDVSKRHLTYLAPVPDETTLIEKINVRLKPIRKRI